MKAVILILVLTGAAALFWTMQDDAGNASVVPSISTVSPGPSPQLVIVAPADYAEIVDTIESIGTTRANESIVLSSKLTDTVSQVHFEDGEYVETGAILVEMTNQEESALLAEAQANLDDARRSLDRQVDLGLRGLTAKSAIDEATARTESAQARMDAITARMNDRLIRAPFSGLLGFREISPGTLLTPNTAITTLDDISVIKLDFSVPEVHLALIRPGFRIEAGSDTWRGRVFEGTVDSIGSRIDPVTRAVTVRALINNEDRLLRPGMLMTVRTITATRQALVIPESAFIQTGDETHVFLAGHDGLARQQPIRIGARRRGYVEVIEGLQEGDPVIIEGGFKLKDQAPFRIGENPERPAVLPKLNSSAVVVSRVNVAV